jgi:hypothetical protein
MFDYTPEQCENIMFHCKEGKSLESFCATIPVSPKVINQWYQDYPEFKEAVEMCPCLELLYWEEALLKAIETRDVSFMNIIKSRIDNLLKYVTSPIKKETYNNFKEDISTSKTKSTGDLVKDFNLLIEGNN